MPSTVLNDFSNPSIGKRKWLMAEKRYLVTGDHPILARPDKVVSELELQPYLHELKMAGFENITSKPLN
jgi:hypothetical protein